MIKLYQIRKIFFAPKTLEFNLEKNLKKKNPQIMKIFPNFITYLFL